MSIENQTSFNDSTLIVSRIRFIGIVFAATGALAITIASNLGENSLRTLLLGTLAVSFLLGGALMGLLITAHVAQTHLPDQASSETQLSPQALEELRIEQELRKSKGFLGLFAVSQDPDREGKSTSSHPPERKTV